jgi:nucleotide-binding universal stress UspA family protein
VDHRWKILAPVDLGSDAEARVQRALNVARALQGDLTLLHVINERSRRTNPVEWPANALASHRSCAIRRLVLMGSLPETVRRYADDLGADLVTVTAGSYRWWNRLWRRSAAAKIAAATDRPMCVATLSAPTPATPFRSIVCVVALDGTDDPLIRFSEEVAQRCDATLFLLHVIPEVSEGLLAFGVPGIEDRPLSREVAQRRLRDLTSGLSRPHLTTITTGSAYREIANLVREHRADVVITGRRDGALSDLDAGALLSRVSCTVISVPLGSRRLVGSSPVYAGLCDAR